MVGEVIVSSWNNSRRQLSFLSQLPTRILHWIPRKISGDSSRYSINAWRYNAMGMHVCTDSTPSHPTQPHLGVRGCTNRDSSVWRCVQLARSAQTHDAPLSNQEVKGGGRRKRGRVYSPSRVGPLDLKKKNSTIRFVFPRYNPLQDQYILYTKLYTKLEIKSRNDWKTRTPKCFSTRSGRKLHGIDYKMTLYKWVCHSIILLVPQWHFRIFTPTRFKIVTPAKAYQVTGTPNRRNEQTGEVFSQYPHEICRKNCIHNTNKHIH